MTLLVRETTLAHLRAAMLSQRPWPRQRKPGDLRGTQRSFRIGSGVEARYVVVLYDSDDRPFCYCGPYAWSTWRREVDRFSWHCVEEFNPNEPVLRRARLPERVCPTFIDLTTGAR